MVSKIRFLEQIALRIASRDAAQEAGSKNGNGQKPQNDVKHGILLSP